MPDAEEWWFERIFIGFMRTLASGGLTFFNLTSFNSLMWFYSNMYTNSFIFPLYPPCICFHLPSLKTLIFQLRILLLLFLLDLIICMTERVSSNTIYLYL
ncbi:unnamed protein product [Choristocarpus tenellus]